MEELLKLFGLKPDATEDEAIVALKALQKTNADQAAKLEEHSAALKAAKADPPDPARFVPVETVNALNEKVAALSARISGREVDELIEQAYTDRKLNEAMEPWARSLGGSDIAALKGWIEKAPTVAPLKGQTHGKKPDGVNEGDGELSEEAVAVCRQMGISTDDYKKTLAEENS